jgi:DNA invertase Pin-like site-specific DNA recombinase
MTELACRARSASRLDEDPGVILLADIRAVIVQAAPVVGRSLQDLVGFLSELHALKIDLFLHQQGLDTTTPAGKAMFQMMGIFAEFERAIFRNASALALRGPGARGSVLVGLR